MAATSALRTTVTLSFFVAGLCFQSTGVAAELTATSTQPTTGQQFAYGVSAGVGYSDNILRTPDNEKDDTFASLGLDLTYKEDSRTLYSDSAIDVVYLDYLQHTFGSEVVGNANINLDARIAPGTFDWLLRDNFGQIRSDPFAPSTPENRENVNYVSTGPQLTAHLGSHTRAQLTGDYSKVTYQRSNSDNDRYGATLGLIRDLSTAAHVSLNVASERVNYKDNTFISDYDTRSAYFNFAANGARTKATVDLGYSQIKRDDETTGGGLIHLQVQRQITPSSTLTLGGGRELTTSGDVFRSDQSLQTISLDTQPATQAVDPLVRKYAQAGWDFMRARTGLGVSLLWSDESHEVQTGLNRKSTTATAYASRAITPNLNARLSVNYLKENYENADISSKELSEALGFAWRVGKMLTTSMQIQHYHRSSDLAGTGYNENRAWLQLTYGNARPLM